MNPLRVAGPLVRFLAILGLLVLGSLLFLSKATSAPSFCGACHEMRPEYETWRASAHEKIRCVTCHSGPGVQNRIRYGARIAREIKSHFLGSYYLPIEVKEPVDDKICLSCHNPDRRPTPAGDIKIPHDRHLEAGFRCTRCHYGAVHGKVAEREVTIDGDWGKWDSVFGRTQMVSQHTRLRMEECLGCHQDEGIETGCGDCHEEKGMPGSHRDADWLTGHGKLAVRDVGYCDKCHSLTQSLVRVHLGGGVQEYARNNTFCSGCHSSKKPPSHAGDWRQRHGERGPEPPPECFVCHDQRPGSGAAASARTACLQCHRGAHPGGIPEFHPVPLQAVNQKIETRCYRCHTKACGRCHYLPG